MIEKFDFTKTEILLSMPVGWNVIKGALTAPKGTVWIFNNKSYFAYDETGNRLRKQALLIVDKKLYETSKFYKERLAWIENGNSAKT